MEMLFVNQHLKLRELKVKQDIRISELASVPLRHLDEVLLDFELKFTL